MRWIDKTTTVSDFSLCLLNSSDYLGQCFSYELFKFQPLILLVHNRFLFIRHKAREYDAGTILVICCQNRNGKSFLMSA